MRFADISELTARNRHSIRRDAKRDVKAMQAADDFAAYGQRQYTLRSRAGLGLSKEEWIEAFL